MTIPTLHKRAKDSNALYFCLRLLHTDLYTPILISSTGLLGISLHHYRLISRHLGSTLHIGAASYYNALASRTSLTRKELM